MCPICKHKERASIEEALLKTSVVEGYTLEDVAKQFECDVNDLKAHALFHTSIVCSTNESISREIKKREADMLVEANEQYLRTLKKIGRRLDMLASTSSIDVEDEEKLIKMFKMITKPVVDLYLGTGNELRQNAKTLAEINRLLNGPQDSASTGLVALANALKESANQ